MFSRLMLPVTYKCNLNCEYCYVDKKINKSMNLRIALLAVDFLIKNNKNKKDPVDIIFIGGEPLLEWKKILKIIFYAKKLASKAKVCIGTIGFPTNGLLLNKIILDFCRKENISVAVSMDGLNNKRKTLNNKNSYYLIEKKLSLLLEYKDIIRIRSTVHPDYVEESAKIFKKFLEMGFVKIDMQPVIGIMWTPEQKKVYLNNLMESFREAERANSESKSHVDMKHLRDFMGTCCEEKGCPKIKEEFLADIDGNIYPCEFYLSIPFEQRKKYMIGDVKKGAKMKLAESCMNHKICDSGDNLPVLKTKCPSCKKSQSCYKICFGYDLQKKKFNPEIAVNNWLFFREIEKVFEKYKHLSK